MPLPQYVIVSKHPPTGNGMVALGNRKQIIGDLARFNTAPDREGDDVLHGPGISLELPPSGGGGAGQDEINQMLLSITEEEIAWLVIMRLAKAFEWKIVDTESGRELNA